MTEIYEIIGAGLMLLGGLFLGSLFLMETFLKKTKKS